MNSVFTDAAEIESIVIMQPIITYETKITSDNISFFLITLTKEMLHQATLNLQKVPGNRLSFASFEW
ncbi:hypothetical protein OAE08_05110 [Gammaproteobacteria bacterium]|jgi:hypothetical protein|nr:hypothetical protein [Gammaproteobacteria bacterium]